MPSLLPSLLVAGLAILCSQLSLLVPTLPFSLHATSFNTATFSRELQEWRARGRYHVFPYFDTSRNISLDLGTFYVDELGTGPAGTGTLLLIHGFPSSSLDFSGAFWEGLRGRFERVVAADYVGFGFSDKPRVEGFDYLVTTYADIQEHLLAALGVRQAAVLAHDLGDTVAQELLARHNEREAQGRKDGISLTSVAFLNGGLFPEQHRAILVQRLLRHPWLGPLLGPLGSRKTFEAALKKVFGPNTQPSAAFLRDTWSGYLFNGGSLVMHKLIRYIDQRLQHRERWVGALQGAKIPITLINGPADPISGRHAAERYKELVPNPRVALLPDGIGHYPQVEAHELVLKEFFRFHEEISKA